MSCFRRAVLSNISHSTNTASVRGVDSTKYIHKLRDTWPFISGRSELISQKILYPVEHPEHTIVSRDDHVPVLKSKNGMLKMDAMKVPGRKHEPINVNVFIDALSRPLLSAKRCC